MLTERRNIDGLSVSIDKAVDSNRATLMLPTYLDSCQYPSWQRLGADLAKSGITAVRFDARGIWESHGTLNDYSQTQYQTDITKVVNDIDESDITLIGFCYSGLNAVINASNEPRINNVVAIAPIQSFTPSEESRKVWKQIGFRRSTREHPITGDLVRFDVPYSFVEDAEQYDIHEATSILEQPVLFIAGGRDEIVPPDMVKTIYEKTLPPKDFIVLDEVSHDYRYSPREIEIVNETILQWLNKS